MIGNAVPPTLTYYIFQSMLETRAHDIKPPKLSDYYHSKPVIKAYESNLGLPKRKYPSNRKFQFSVPHLRYGSGVRFELSNNPKSKSPEWSFKFFYGNSKNIKEIQLNDLTKNILSPTLNTSRNEIFTELSSNVIEKYKDYSSEKLQEIWTSTTRTNEVFKFLDEVGHNVKTILDEADFNGFDEHLLKSVTQENNTKLYSNKESILTGLYFLSTLNKTLFY